MLVAVNFHYVRESFEAPYPAIFGMTPAAFGRQLDLLGRHFTFVGPDDIVAALGGGQALPDAACVVTFDDGLAEQFEHAWPILQDKGIPAIFYVNTDTIGNGRLAPVHKNHLVRSAMAPARIAAQVATFVDSAGVDVPADVDRLARAQYRYDDADTAQLKYLLNFVLDDIQQAALLDACAETLPGWDEQSVARSLYMDRDMLVALDRHGLVGTHYHQHLPVGTLGRAEVDWQLQTSLSMLRDWGVQRVTSVSYPFGGPTAVSREAAELAAQAGMHFGFTMERAINRDLDCPFLLSRFSNSDLPGGGKTDATVEQFIAAQSPATRFGLC